MKMLFRCFISNELGFQQENVLRNVSGGVVPALNMPGPQVVASCVGKLEEYYNNKHVESFDPEWGQSEDGPSQHMVLQTSLGCSFCHRQLSCSCGCKTIISPSQFFESFVF